MRVKVYIYWQCHTESSFSSGSFKRQMILFEFDDLYGCCCFYQCYWRCLISQQPAVYVAESAISSGAAGTSSDGAENTVAVVAGIGLIAVAAASSILLQVGKNSPPPIQTVEYSGPSLSYYINKLKPAEIVQASVTEAPTAPEVEDVQASVAPGTEAPNAPEVESSAPQVEVQSEAPQDTSSPNIS